jgi:hypothetical protein
VLFLTLAAVLPSWAAAEGHGAPVIPAVFPPGGARGARATIDVRGSNLGSATHVLVSGEGVTARPGAYRAGPQEKPEESELTVEVDVAPAAVPGLRALRVVTVRAEPSQIRLKPGEKTKLTVRGTRKPDAAGARGKLDLRFADLPEGVTADMKPIEEGKDQVEIQLTATAKAAKATDTLILIAWREETDFVAPPLTLTVAD